MLRRWVARWWPERDRGPAADAAWARLRRADADGRGPREPLFAALAAEGGASPQAIAADFAARFAAEARLAEGVATALRALQAAGLPWLVVSNGGGARQRAKLAAAGLRLEREPLISGELGAAKPEPPIFREALARLALPPEAVVMVGDDAEADIAGAAGCGLMTAWVSHGAEWVAPQTPPDLCAPSAAALLEAIARRALARGAATAMG